MKSRVLGSAAFAISSPVITSDRTSRNLRARRATVLRCEVVGRVGDIHAERLRVQMRLAHRSRRSTAISQSSPRSTIIIAATNVANDMRARDLTDTIHGEPVNYPIPPNPLDAHTLPMLS